MKKISLKDVKNSLKRDEMRVISGGCGASSCKCGGSNPVTLPTGCSCRCYCEGYSC